MENLKCQHGKVITEDSGNKRKTTFGLKNVDTYLTQRYERKAKKNGITYFFLPNLKLLGFELYS